MTNTEIKKAWETMKKELKKELGIEGGFTMGAKQINNRTATYLVCNIVSYEEEIKRAKDSNAIVQAYDSWTAEEKAKRNAETERQVAQYEELLAKYGTKENELRMVHEELVNSKAFQKFASNFENVTTEVEFKENFFYYIRFNY